MSEDKLDESTKSEAGVFRELAEAQLKLSTLLLDFPDYKRRFIQILKSPIGFFRSFSHAGKGEFKHAFAFMLQSITLSFVIFTMGWALPRSLANFVATNASLISGSKDDLITYVQRVQEINRNLPPELAKAWREQGELMLLTRTLPEDRFRILLQRLYELSDQNPELLRLAIDGSLTYGERFGGRAYILTFFLALDPTRGTLLDQTHQVTAAGPHYKLQPHVEFLLRSVLLWYITCFIAARLLRSSPKYYGSTAFVIGAYLSGFLNPLVQTFDALVRCYLAVTLPAYITKASQFLVNIDSSQLGQISGGVFPYENLILAVVQLTAWTAFAGIAVTALAVGIRNVFHVSKGKGWAVASVSLAFGSGATEAVTSLAILILAPTNLL